MTHSHHRRAEIERAARRLRVADLLVSGTTDQVTIAGLLSVNQSTVSRDIKAIESQWRERAAEAIDLAKGLDLARAERLIEVLWSDALNGKLPVMDRVLALMQHRARLLGLSAPDRREETQRVEVALIVARIAQETGLTTDEIVAEAQRIIRATGHPGDA